MTMARRSTTGARRFKWQPRHLELLGKISDERLAEKAGVSPGTVRAERRRRGISPANSRREPAEWTDEMIERLGKDTDAAVAEELGLSKQVVYQKRRLLGIEPACPEARRNVGSSLWTSEVIARMGQESDGAIAKDLGVRPATVSFKRRTLGIEAFTSMPERIEWTQEMISQLGTMSDAEYARRFGVSICSVALKRVELKIEPHCARGMPILREAEVEELLRLTNAEVKEQTGCCSGTIWKLRVEYGIPAPDPRQLKWTPEILARFGKEPDWQIAEDLGLAEPTVTAKRNSLGYPPFRKWGDWTPEALARLGNEPDSKIAEDLGITRSAVTNMRNSRGIQAHAHRNRFNWTPEALARLGKLSDTKIAEELGLSPCQVAKKRRRLGIPSWRATTEGKQ